MAKKKPKEDEDDPLTRIVSMKRAAKFIGRDVAEHRNIPLEDFSKYIRPKEIVTIIKQFAVIDEESDNYYINGQILKKIFSEVHDWVLGITLSRMASDDMIDTFWDSKLNCMTFGPKPNKEKSKDGKEDI